MEQEHVDYNYEDYRLAEQREIETNCDNSLKFMRRDNATKTADVFENRLRKEHRTHQANVIRFMLHVLLKYKDAPHDLRNERPVEVCNIISDLDETENFYIPYI